MNMTRFVTICYVLLLASGCGRQPAPAPAAAVDTTQWSLTVDSFSQLDSQSALKISVDTPVQARVTFHEPHSQTSQSFIYPGGVVYDIRKTLEPTDTPDTHVLKTHVNGSGPCKFFFAGIPKPPFDTLQQPVVSGTATAPFGEPIVVATHGSDGQTWVTVDLEKNLDGHLVHADHHRVNQQE